MTKKLSAYIVAALLLLPLAASAGDLPSLVQALATLKTTSVQGVVVPAARLVGISRQAQVDCSDIKGTQIGGKQVYVPNDYPPSDPPQSDGDIALVMVNGEVQARFTDVKGNTIFYAFAGIAVTGRAITCGGTAIGDVEPIPTAHPILNAEYYIQYYYDVISEPTNHPNWVRVYVEIIKQETNTQTKRTP